MSRTDHHMPDWVTVEWWEATHVRCPHATSSWRTTSLGFHECDLPDEPVREHPFRRRRPGRRPVCYWEPDLSSVSPWPRPPRWYVDHVWHNPERRRLRDELRAAAAEWRAAGNVENDPPAYQARHSAGWMWS